MLEVKIQIVPRIDCRDVSFDDSSDIPRVSGEINDHRQLSAPKRTWLEITRACTWNRARDRYARGPSVMGGTRRSYQRETVARPRVHGLFRN